MFHWIGIEIGKQRHNLIVKFRTKKQADEFDKYAWKCISISNARICEGNVIELDKESMVSDYYSM